MYTKQYYLYHNFFHSHQILLMQSSFLQHDGLSVCKIFFSAYYFRSYSLTQPCWMSSNLYQPRGSEWVDPPMRGIFAYFEHKFWRHAYARLCIVLFSSVKLRRRRRIDRTVRSNRTDTRHDELRTQYLPTELYIYVF